MTPDDLPDAEQVFTPAGPGPAGQVAQAVRLALSGGTVHLGRLLAAAGVRYVVVVDAVAPSMVGTVTPSVSAPPPAGLQTDLLEQDDLQVVPGLMGVQVYENSEDMPVTGQRAAPLPASTAWTYPGPADVAGWQAVLGDLSQGASAARARSGAGSVYAGYAPAGSFALDRWRAGRDTRGRPSGGPPSTPSPAAGRRSRSPASPTSPWSWRSKWPPGSCWRARWSVAGGGRPLVPEGEP